MMRCHLTRSAQLGTLLLLLSLPLAAEEPPPEAPAETTGEPMTHERQTLPTPEEQRTAALALLQSPGERLTLNANGSDFPALFLDSERAARHGGVILLHDNGGHADWPGVIGPLRRGLPPLGWATLSLQLPLPPRITLELPPRSLPPPTPAEGEAAAEEQTEASTPPAAPEPPATAEEEQPPLLEQARPRIATAVEQLRSRGIDNIVLVGHGLGALMAADYLAGNLAAGVSAAVLVGVDGYDGTEPAELIGRIERPLLDLYGTRDLEGVVNGAEARAAAARRAEGLTGQQFQQQQRLRVHGKDRSDAIQYRQLAIAGADHSFTGLQPVLLKRVHGWLLRHTGK